MDTSGSIKDISIRIVPSKKLEDFIRDIKISDDTPNSIRIFKGEEKRIDLQEQKDNSKSKSYMKSVEITAIKSLLSGAKNKESSAVVDSEESKDNNLKDDEKITDVSDKKEKRQLCPEKYLVISDLEWLSTYLSRRLKEEQDCVYLHELLEGSDILLPENEIIKRNPVLEARCVRLRRDQSNRDYRSMTKNVDNVRVRQPEETIAYQLKGLNRQLIAVGQFVMSIGAGFLFGFLGLELMIGGLDFGFRLLLGVMCALIIAIAEIYFLAKKLSEDLYINETTQLGGPPVYPDLKSKSHQD